MDGLRLYGQDSLRPLAQLNSSRQIEATFVYETGVNVPDYIVQNSGAVLRVITDHLGSVRLVVNVSSGTVAQRMDYDEFGNVSADSNPNFQPFGFAGGLYDEATGLVRFGVRDYDALTGRWTTKDPIGFDGLDTNLYRYAAGDPVNNTDVTGLDLAGWSGFPSCEEHRERNVHNRCPSRPPSMCETSRDWFFDETFGDKYRGSDGSECKYDDDGRLLEPEGSFNYTPSYAKTNDFWRHVWQDVLPIVVCGAHAPGRTTVYFRVHG